MYKIKEKFQKIRAPHTYVILSIILLIIILMTYIIPSGEYLRYEDEKTGKMIVDPTSFHFVDGKLPKFFDIFLSIQKGYVSAANIMFLIIFAYAFVYNLTENGTLNAYINLLILKLKGNNNVLIAICMIIFGILSSTLGIFEEVYGLIPVFIELFLMLGYDRIVGGSIVYLGVATGFAAATTNPFSIGIAKEIAELPMSTGIAYRIFTFVVFEFVTILYVIKYAEMIHKNPQKSVLYDDEVDMKKSELKRDIKKPDIRNKICILLFLITVIVILYGTAFWDWYIDEISAWFLMMTIITGIVSGFSAYEIADNFIKSTKSIIPSILVVGFTRSIIIVMNDAMISDTIVYYLSSILNFTNKICSAVGMLIIQNIINFFITGSSSQATITLPIMIPVADIIGLDREVAIIAYTFGDGFSDIFWPTACSLQCALMGIPIDKWYKFVTPLFFIMAILQVILISVYTIVLQ